MKIFINPLTFNLKENKSELKQINKTSDKTINKTNLSYFPNYSYQIAFGANKDNLENFYQAYGNGNGMPASYSFHLSTYTPAERSNITEVFTNYHSFYKNIENCHSIDELKKEFPTEFKNIQSALLIKSKNNSFINKFNDLALSIAELGEYVFPQTQDNDLTVYLAKKIYLESKTKNEIDKDFYNDINNFYTIEDYKTRFPNGKDGIIPQNIYKDLGLTTGKNESGFRHSLCCSRDDYIQKYGSVYKAKRKETFNKFINDVLDVTNNEKPIRHNIKANSATYEKYKYAMFLAWNNSIELRKALSEYLFNQKQGNALLKPDFIEINVSKENDNLKMREIMKGFWIRNPKLRVEFSETCKKAFEDVENAIDNGKFEEFKNIIENQRQSIYDILAFEKAEKEEMQRLKELEQQKARELLEKKAMSKNITKDCLQVLSKIKPIPSNLFKPTLDKIQENLPEITLETPYRDINKIRNICLEETNNRIGQATSHTFLYYYFNTNNKPSTDFDKQFNKLLRSIKTKILEMPEYKSVFDNIGISNYIVNEELSNISNTFVKKVFINYIIYLVKNNTNNISYINRKKIINNIYEYAINTDEYINTCKNQGIRPYIFKEFTNLLCEIPIQELLNVYRQHYMLKVIKNNEPLVSAEL